MKDPKPKLDAMVINVIVGKIIPKSAKFFVSRKIAEIGSITKILAFAAKVVIKYIVVWVIFGSQITTNFML